MRRTVAALVALLLPAVAAAQPSPTFTTLHVNGAASLLGGGTHTGTFTGGTFSGITLGGSITGTGATITGGTFSGITLSGIIAGAPTLSGSWDFQATTVVGSNTTGQILRLNGATGSAPILEFANAGVKQFHWQTDGSFNLQGFTYDAAGATPFQWLKVVKATGDTTLSGPLTANGNSITLQPTSPVFSGVAVAPIKTTILNVTGSFTNNPSLLQNTITADTASTANGARLAIGMSNFTYNYGGTGHEGGRVGLTVQMTQAGITDANNGDGSYTPGRWWVDHFFPSGGTSFPSAAGGFVYGGNWKPQLHQGAQFYGVYNGLGETDYAVEGSTQLVTIGGTITAGDTLSLTFTSASIVGSPVTATVTAAAADTTTTLAAKLFQAIQTNDALHQAAAGASYGGTTGVNSTSGAANKLMLVWGHWIGLTVSSAVGGAATETITLGSVTAGASTNEKYGMTIVQLNNDGVPGFISTTMIAPFGGTSSGSASAWNYGIRFGGNAGSGGRFPMDPFGTLFATGLQTTTAGIPASQNRLFAALDVRLTNFTLSAGRPILTPNFRVHGDGTTRIGAGLLTPTTTGISFDASGWDGSSVLNAGGTNYFVGDIGVDANDGQYQVTAINATTGAVTAFNTLVAPTATSGSAPSTAQAVSGGSGAGWTVTATWAAGTKLQLGASVNTLIGSGSALATNATSGFLQVATMAGAPTGTVGAAGQAAIVVDTTNKKVCYSTGGGTWECSAAFTP